jgi:hypothetical protein
MKHKFPNGNARVALAILFVGLIASGTAATPQATDVGSPASPMVFSGAGDIGPIMDQFRAALGEPDNGGEPGSHPTGRREINWDGVPDEFAAPNFLPAEFFNDTAEPRARGAVLSTPGDGVQVSADSDNAAQAAMRFGHINPTYTTIFKAFSEERLFSPVGSNTVNLTFRVPGTQEPAVVRGFGAVYTDVDRQKTSFRYYDKDGNLLGKFKVPASVEGLSFLGVVFDQPVVARVRIKYGTVPLGPDDSAKKDVAVMDDFIYGEPQAISSSSPSN